MINAPNKAGSLTWRFVFFLLLGAVPLVLVLAFTTWKDLETDQNRAITDLQQGLDFSKSRIESFLETNSRYLRQLTMQAESIALNPERNQGGTVSLAQFLSAGPLGKGYSLDSLAAQADVQGLGNYLVASRKIAGKAYTIDTMIALGLFRAMEAGHRTIDSLASTYYRAATEDSASIFPFASSQTLLGSTQTQTIDDALGVIFDNGGVLPLRLVGPPGNPGKSLVWSDPFLDPEAPRLIVSVLAPVWVADHFQGAIGTDINLSSLGTLIRHHGSNSGTATLVVDSSGNVLGDSLGRLEDPRHISHITELYPEFPLPRGLSYSPETLARRGGYTFMTQTLTSPHWTILSVTNDEAYFRARGVSVFDSYIVSGLAALVYLIAGILLTLYFARPAGRLTVYLEEVLQRPRSTIPRVPSLWRGTFERIGALARERVQAIDQVRAERAGLEQTVKERTKELSETNRELIDNMVRLRDTKNLLVRSEKLAALGRLVAGVAHELNTPIGNALTMGSTLHNRTLELRTAHNAGTMTNKAFSDYLDTMVESTALLESEINRSASLVNDFKQVALDQTSVQRRVFLLDEVIAEVCATIRPRFKEGPWTLAVEVQPGITMDSYPGPLGQILDNLAFNSLTHGFDGKTEGIFKIEALHHGREHVAFLITDNGRGIPPEHHEKVFEPFFTTRRDSENIGLGLNIVQHLVTTILGGSIELESDINRGCLFRIVVPLVAPHTTLSGVSHG